MRKPTAPQPLHGQDYRRDIDGLRSVAVLSVVAYHAGWSALSGGFAGVDVFFVISGYLITSLILNEQAADRFRLKNFYIRRARRLFPALFVVLAISSLAAWWLLMPGEMEDFGESLATAAVFSSNFMFFSEAGYFEGPSEFKPLLHTWSLAIEEQYYLLFPLLLLACKKTGRYLSIMLPVALVSLALAEWFVGSAPAATFFLLPHRLWELMVGSLLASATVHQRDWFTCWPAACREALALGGLIAIGYTMLSYSNATAFPGLAALLPTLGTAALIAAGTGGVTVTSQALASRPMVAIGLISYSLYLWHWPVLVFAKLFLVRPPTPTETLLAVAAAFVLGWASWRFVERPFRTNRQPVTASQGRYRDGLIPDSKILATSLACIVLLATIGLALDNTDGAPWRLPSAITEIAAVVDDKPPERKYCSNIRPAEISVDRLCTLGANDQPPDFLLWGDSHAMTLAPRFAEVALENSRSGLSATSDGCAALLNVYPINTDPNGECLQFNAAVLELIAANPEIKTIVLSGRWAIYAEATRYKHESGKSVLLAESGTADTTTENSNTRIWQRALLRTLHALKQLNKTVVVIDSVPEVGWNTPPVIARSVLLERPVRIAPTLAEFLLRQRHVRPVFSALEEKVLHPQQLLCDSRVCQVAINNQPLYVDEDHLSSAGSRLLLPLVREALEPAL